MRKNEVNSKKTIKWLKEMRALRKKEGYFETHGHGPYSDGGRIYYKYIAKSNIKGVTISDHGTMSGTQEHYKEMQKIGKTAGIANEFYIDNIMQCTYRNVLVKSENPYYHILLIAKNQTGLKNLNKLTMMSYNKIGSYGKNILNPVDLANNKDGLICLTACIGGEIPQYIIHGQIDYAERLTFVLKALFEDDFYLELQVHGLKEEKVLIPELIELSKRTGVKLVSSTDYHYSKKSGRKLRDIQYCKLMGLTLDNDRVKKSLDGFLYHIPASVEEAELRLSELPPEVAAEALDSTIEIWEKCKDLKISYAENPEDYKFPKPKLPEGINNYDIYLKKLVFERFEKMIEENPHMNASEYVERIERELSVISKLGYSSYFIVTYETVNFCNESNIWVGPGRGSAAGSLVLHILGVTDIDPIKYGLLFERFLNYARKSMPDVDLDYCFRRREEVLEFMKKEYGIDSDASNCARIIAFGKWQAKSGIKDAGRILKYDPAFYEKLAKIIPNLPGLKLKDLIRPSKEFQKKNKALLSQTKALRDAYESDEGAKEIIDYAIKLQGLRSSNSKHPAGFIVADKSLWNYIPVRRMKHNDEWVLVTEYSKEELEELGLVKFDILPLRTGTQLSDCVNLINKNKATRGETDFISLKKIPFEDRDTCKLLLMLGYTLGIFQAEGKEMTRLIMTIMNLIDKNFFEALIQIISINRPGPKQYIPQLIENIKNPEGITYLHESLREILETTYGILSYQEQVSMIFQKLANFTPEEADDVRKIMSSKNMDAMMKLKESFISGCINNEIEDIEENLAIKIFTEIEDFALYAFNKSHAAAYTVLLMQTAWLKYYYPVEFMTTLLDSASQDKLPLYISEAKRMGITVLPPCINNSSYNFTMESENTIRFGLKAIKNIGEKAAELIEQDRLENGEFSDDYQDFVNRLNDLKINSKNSLNSKRVLEALIYSGATDCIKLSRKTKIEELETVSSKAKKTKTKKNKSLLVLDEIYTPKAKSKIKDIGEFSKTERFSKEIEYLSTFVSEHVLDDYLDIIQNSDVDYLADVLSIGEETEKESDTDQELDSLDESYEFELEDEEDEGDGRARIIGFVTRSEVLVSKKGNDYLSYTITDHTGSYDGFAGEQYRDILKEGNVVHLNGEIEKDPTYGIKINWPIVSRVFGENDIIYSADELEISKDSTAVVYINTESDIEAFEEIEDILFEGKCKSRLLFKCKDNGDIFQFKDNVNLKNTKVLEFIKENSFGVIIR